MSGHSKWSSIKHKKASTDARRSKSFTQVANLIAVAARQGGADPEMNFKLRLAITKAKAVNMPAANIERSIKRGAGELGGGQIEEVIYEAMLPGGSAVIIECATDNRNRTGPEVRTAVTKSGGRLADVGSVMYQFDQKGVITLQTNDLETATLDAIEVGADDVHEEDGELTIYTKKNDLNAVQLALSQAGYEIKSAALEFVPSTTIMVSDEEQGNKIMKIMDALDDLDDVTATHANFDFSADLSEKLQ